MDGDQLDDLACLVAGLWHLGGVTNELAHDRSSLTGAVAMADILAGVSLDDAAVLRVHQAVVDGDLDALRREFEPVGGFPNTSPHLAIGYPLVYAISHGSISLIEQLLDIGADPDASDGDGFPPIIAAISSGAADPLAIISLLLERGADIEQRGVNDYTPLHMAVESNAEAIVDLLLDRGADPNAVTRIDDVETPYEIAVARGHTSVAEKLRPRTTRIDWEAAIETGDVRGLQQMVAGGWDIDSTDGFSQTALMRCAHAGHVAAVAWLVDHGAELDRSSKFGLTPLLLAVNAGHADVARALVKAGADTTLVGSGPFAKSAVQLAQAAGDRRLAEFIRSNGQGSGGGGG